MQHSESMEYGEVEPLNIKSALMRRTSKAKLRGPREQSPLIGSHRPKKAVTFDRTDEVITYEKMTPDNTEWLSSDGEWEIDEFEAPSGPNAGVADAFVGYHPLPQVPETHGIEKSSSEPSLHSTLLENRMSREDRLNTIMESSPMPSFKPGHRHKDSWRGSWGTITDSLGQPVEDNKDEDEIEVENRLFEQLPAVQRKESLQEMDRRAKVVRVAVNPPPPTQSQVERSHSTRKRALKNALSKRNEVAAIQEEDEESKVWPVQGEDEQERREHSELSPLGAVEPSESSEAPIPPMHSPNPQVASEPASPELSAVSSPAEPPVAVPASPSGSQLSQLSQPSQPSQLSQLSHMSAPSPLASPQLSETALPVSPSLESLATFEANVTNVQHAQSSTPVLTQFRSSTPVGLPELAISPGIEFGFSGAETSNDSMVPPTLANSTVESLTLANLTNTSAASRQTFDTQPAMASSPRAVPLDRSISPPVSDTREPPRELRDLEAPGRLLDAAMMPPKRSSTPPVPEVNAVPESISMPPVPPVPELPEADELEASVSSASVSVASIASMASASLVEVAPEAVSEVAPEVAPEVTPEVAPEVPEAETIAEKEVNDAAISRASGPDTRDIAEPALSSSPVALEDTLRVSHHLDHSVPDASADISEPPARPGARLGFSVGSPELEEKVQIASQMDGHSVLLDSDLSEDDEEEEQWLTEAEAEAGSEFGSRGLNMPSRIPTFASSTGSHFSSQFGSQFGSQVGSQVGTTTGLSSSRSLAHSMDSLLSVQLGQSLDSLSTDLNRVASTATTDHGDDGYVLRDSDSVILANADRPFKTKRRPVPRHKHADLTTHAEEDEDIVVRRQRGVVVETPVRPQSPIQANAPIFEPSPKKHDVGGHEESGSRAILDPSDALDVPDALDASDALDAPAALDASEALPELNVPKTRYSVRPTSMPAPATQETEQRAARPLSAQAMPRHKGHLFIAIDAVTKCTAPEGSLTVTIDNGEQSITSAPVASAEHTRVNQEYDLLVRDGLECELTVRVTPKPAKSKIAKLFKRRSAGAPIAADGTVGTCTVNVADIRQAGFGRVLELQVPCFDRSRQAATCEVALRAMYVPVMSRSDKLPTSLAEAQAEVEAARALKQTAMTGFMTQHGGDVGVKRRYFVLDDDMLIAHSQSSFKARATINLRKAVYLSPDADPNSFRINFRNGASIQFVVDADRQQWMQALDTTINNKRSRASWVSLVLADEPLTA